MIPKIIHYCWFGKNKKPKLVRDCIKSWEIMHPDYRIIEWNEKNFPMDNDFLQHMYKQKKWAFVSDYARLKILYEYGGYYLDTDMFLVKRLDSLEVSENIECILCAEEINLISAGFFGCQKKNNFIYECLTFYHEMINSSNIYLKSIPEIITKEFSEHYSNNLNFKINVIVENLLVLEFNYFYPFPRMLKRDVKNFLKYKRDNTIGIHLWSYSWEEVNEYILIERKKYYSAFKIILKNILSFDSKIVRKYLGNVKGFIIKYAKKLPHIST